MRLAALHDGQGRYEEAEGYYCRALSLLTTVMGSDHKETTQCRDKYADLLRVLGRDEEADRLAQNTQIVVQERRGVGV